MAIQRLPAPALRPFVALLWADDCPGVAPPATREHVLPTGLMHLVFRSPGNPVRVCDSQPGSGHALPGAIVGGARQAYYVREATRARRTAGALLRPGAAQLLFGVSAAELAGEHWDLRDLWGADADDVHGELIACENPQRRLDRLEALLLARLPRVRGIHPAVAQALAVMPDATRIAPLVQQAGVSHRRFIALFRDTVGLPPKAFARVLRFQRALRGTAGGTSLADVAAAAGYSDQAHFSREFRELAGVPPAAYLRLAEPASNHMPLHAGQNHSRRGAVSR